jgi:uncharacterized protein YndB with AHSA1/START domain
MAAIPPIRLSIDVPVDIVTAWASLTEPARVAAWFTDASPLGQAGDAYRLDFGDGSVVEGRLLELEPGHRFVYTWAWADAEPRQETRVAWRVDPATAGGTRISLEHDGWAEAGADEAARDDHEAYWSGYLDDLAALLGEA